MTTLLKRSIFGAIYVAVIVLSCLCWTPYLSGALFLVLAVLTAVEYGHIMHLPRYLTIEVVLLTALLYVASFGICGQPYKWMYSVGFYTLIAYFLLFFCAILKELFDVKQDTFSHWGTLFCSQFWIALPFAMLIAIAKIQPMALLSLFAIIWVYDTGAYCVGSVWSKFLPTHKLAPMISPAKTWEGFFGGLVVAVAVGYVFLVDPFHFTHIPDFFAKNQVSYSALTACVFTSVIVIFATLGDLLESRVKRILGIKDSGNALPGHGGWLDRLDSTLFALHILLIPALLLLIEFLSFFFVG